MSLTSGLASHKRSSIIVQVGQANKLYPNHNARSMRAFSFVC